MDARTGSRALAGLVVAAGLLLVGFATLEWPRSADREEAPETRDAEADVDVAPARGTGFLPVPQASMNGPSVSRLPSLFVSASGSDTGPCSREAPCAGFGRAYAVARPGEVVQVAAGHYGRQELPGFASKPAEGGPVVFRPAEGAQVTTGELRFGGPLAADRGPSGITVRDMTIGGFVSQGSSRLTFLNVTMHGNFAIEGGASVAVIGGSVGGTRDGSHSEIVAWLDADERVEPAENVLVDGVTFHDVRMSTPADHVECLQATDARRLVIRNSRFIRCDTFDLRVDRYRTDGPQDLLIENNVFVHTRDRFGGNVFYGLAVRAGSDVVIRHNSSDIGWAGPEVGTPIRRWVISANAMPGGRCDDRIAYQHNLWISGEGCDPSDLEGDPGFVDTRRGDLRLRPGSPALDTAGADGAPAFDHRGHRRVRPDIGAFEGSARSD
jgi:hypothetical protein